MTCGRQQSYRFFDEAHWRTMAGRNTSVDEGGITIAPATTARVIVSDGKTAGVPPGSEVDRDQLGRLLWVTPDRRVVCRYPIGPVELGRLDRPVGAEGTEPYSGRGPEALVVGCGTLWLLVDGRIERYARTDLQYMGSVEPSERCRIVAMVGDEDGLWCLESCPVDGGRELRLRHLDCWGRTCCQPVIAGPAGDEGDEAARTPLLAAGSGRSRLVVWRPDHPQRFTVVDGCDGTARTVCVGGTDRHTVLALSSDDEGDLHLLSMTDDQHDDQVQYEVVDLSGRLQRRQTIALPPGITVGDISGLILGEPTVVITAKSLVELLDRPTSAESTAAASLITPAMVSPDLAEPGWHRAEVAMSLPAGASVSVAWASTSDRQLYLAASAVSDDPTLSPDEQFERLDGLLPWQAPAASYVGRAPGSAGPGTSPGAADTPPEDVTLPVRLGTADSHLWLRVEMQSPVGSGATPTLRQLTVRYPADSYLQHLPAIYRRDQESIEVLEQLLAPIESLFDELDDELDQLPSRIDPETAPDGWTAFLLSWLGFPPLGDLDPDLRRQLLRCAGPLLADRGTVASVQSALRIVTGTRTTVTESAAQPDVWMLPADRRPGARWSRLGSGTTVRAQDPTTLRVGRGWLGRARLGQGCSDPAAMVAAQAGTVLIRIEADNEERARLEPIVRRLLPVLLPAHCRVELVFADRRPPTSTRSLDGGLRLDDGTDGRLYHSDHWRLGKNAAAGAWRLADPPAKSATLDRRRLVDEVRLN